MKEQIKSENIDAKFDMPAGAPTFDVVLDDKKNIIDYLNVKIEGYGNTFELDRGGDMCLPGCFVEHLEEYKENPILLADHERTTKNAIGRVFSAYEDEVGLKVSARLSNAPDVKDIRFKVAEGVLKTFSIGGMFHVKYGKDINYIDKVELREISVVTVPMNKKSLFEVKADDDKLKANSNENQLGENIQADDQKNGVNESESDTYIIINDKKHKLVK